MSYYIGPILVDDSYNASTGSVFPIPSQFPWQIQAGAEVIIHQFGDGDSKVEQRFYKGPGITKFVVNLQGLSPQRRQQLVTFWNELGGPQNSFYYDAPNLDGLTTTRYAVAFDPSQSLQWTQVSDLLASASVTLLVVAAPSSTYTSAQTVTRFPTSALAAALLDPVQQLIPLLTIRPLSWSNTSSFISFINVSGGSATASWSSATATHCVLYKGDPLNPQIPATTVASGGATGTATIAWDAGDEYVLMDSDTDRVIASATIGATNPIYLSDRYCTVDQTLYVPRILGHQGISQELGPADDATFQLSNADRAFSRLKSVVNLNRAEVEFRLFHVGTNTLIEVWKGEVKSWSADEGPVFAITCSDSIYELTLQYPTRTISRSCWKKFNDGMHCPYSSVGSGGNGSFCDKGFDTLNGCQSHGMDDYFGGIIANPQAVTIRDNGSNGRPKITATSIVSDTMYGKPLQQVYTNIEMPVNCIIADGRDESDFYSAIGIVGEGPIGSFGAIANQLLDGQPQNYPFSPAECLGNDPESTPFSLDAGGQYQYPYKAAGVARLNIRRTDTKGIQASSPDQHSMVCTVSQGLQGLIWTAPGQNHWGTLTNPIWVAVNALLKAKGLGLGTYIGTQEAQFDVASAVAAAAICDLQVQTLVYDRNPVQLPVDGANVGQNNWTPFTPTEPQLPNETQFEFIGVIANQQPLRDWIDQILLNCNGYWSTAFGKVRFGIRENAGAVEAFTLGNMLFKSYAENPIQPRFDRLTASFADRDFNFQQNTVTYYDDDYATSMGSVTQRFEDGQVNLSGTVTASQAMRLIATRGREEMGGINEFEWKNAVIATWKTTILSLNTECGQVVSVSHPAVSGGYGKFRIQKWTLNDDLSIQITAQTVTDSMYDLEVGPKPSDVMPPWVPTLPAVATNTIPIWSPTGYAYPATVVAGHAGKSTFNLTVDYSTLTDGTLQISVVASGVAPVTEYFTQNRPTIGSLIPWNYPSGQLVAGSTYYFAVCGTDANANLSAPSHVVSCTMPVGTNTVSLEDVVYPQGSVGRIAYGGATRDSMIDLGTNPVVDTNIGFTGGIASGLPGFPMDGWTNVRVRLKAKKVYRSGVVRTVITGVNTAQNLITVEPGVIQADNQYVGMVLSLIGDPQGGNLQPQDCVIAQAIAGTNTYVLTPPSGQANIALRVGQVVVVRTTPTVVTDHSIGSDYWDSVDYPGGLPTNGDVGRFVRIIGGVGVGQTRQVLSNSAGTHFLSSPWDVMPNGSSIYIIEDGAYQWQADSPVISNSNPLTQISIPLNMPGLTENINGLLIIGVIASNGFEGEEENAPFREIALLTASDLEPSSVPASGSWWSAKEEAWNTPNGWLMVNPLSLPPSGGQVHYRWHTYLNAPSTLGEGLNGNPVVLGAILANEGNGEGDVTLNTPNNGIYYVVNNYPDNIFADCTVNFHELPYPADGGVRNRTPEAMSQDNVINYGTYGYPGMIAIPSPIPQYWFYARFVGYVWAPVDGLYTFGLNVDDGGNLYVNGKKLVAFLGGEGGLAPHKTYNQSGQIYLTGNRSYRVVVEWAQFCFGSGLQVLWTPPGATAPDFVPFGRQSTLNASSLLNAQGSIVPAAPIPVTLIGNDIDGNGKWHFAIGWQASAVPRADQSSVTVPAGQMGWNNLNPGTAYIYSYVDPANGSLHVASGDGPATPPSVPSTQYALACYYDGRIPLPPFSVSAPSGGGGSETGTITTNPSSLPENVIDSVVINWNYSSVPSGNTVKIMLGSANGVEIATADSTSGTISSGPYITAGSMILLVDTTDGVVLASVAIGDDTSPGDYGGSYGGQGMCPEENCLVYVQGRKVIRAGEVYPGQLIRGEDLRTKEIVYRKVLSVEKVHSSTWYIVEGQRVSPHDDICLAGTSSWIKPYRFGTFDSSHTPSYRVKILVDGATYDDHNYHIVDAEGNTLFTMHNYLVNS